VHVLLGHVGQVEIDDVRHVGHIDAACRDVCGDEDTYAAVAKGRQSLDAAILRPVPVNGVGRNAGFAELQGQALCPVLGSREDEDAAERAVWERDLAKVEADLPRLEAFFGVLLDGKLSEEERTRQGMSFISTEDVPQGAYYTVGWLMSSVVERELGRKKLVESVCDPAMFLRDYHRAAKGEMNRGRARLPLWSEAFLARLDGR